VKQYPAASTIHLVMDNLNIHTRKSLTDYFGEQKGGDIWDRLTVHYTPKHGNWLNPAEIERSLYARQCLGKRRIPDLKKLWRQTKAWNRRANQKRTKIHWRFTRKKAREIFKYKPPRHHHSPRPHLNTARQNRESHIGGLRSKSRHKRRRPSDEG